MRGTHQIRDVSADIHGIIPAYAGSTRAFRRSWLLPWDHPRVCGEHRLAGLVGHVPGGSSPRMRGTPYVAFQPVVPQWIIPAYAGNTYSLPLNLSDLEDHPRVCGEHFSVASHLRVNPGSSPRMRGTHAARRMPRHRPGIIPAYAGNTFVMSHDFSLLRDHPRVCGEHLASA